MSDKPKLYDHVSYIDEKMVDSTGDQTYGWYKDRRFYMVWRTYGNYPTIDGVEMCVLGFSKTEWIIVPSSPQDDHKVDMMGPYDSLEEAVINMKLRCTLTS